MSCRNSGGVPDQANSWIFNGPRNAQDVDIPNELEDPPGLEVSGPEGVQIIVREGFGRYLNSPRLSSRTNHVGPMAGDTPGAALYSDHGGDKLIRLGLRAEELNIL